MTRDAGASTGAAEAAEAAEAYEIQGRDRPGPWLVTCDHASNAVPDWVEGGDLGLPPGEMGRHIAYDIGAAGVAGRLGALLDAPVILSRFSRLVVDLNRGEDDPTLITQLYDGTIVPGNRRLDRAAREERLDRLYRPYHAAISRLLGERGEEAIYLAIHSFTPRLSGRSPRPWHVTVLAAEDKRFSAPLLERLAGQEDLLTAENEPYTGALEGDSVFRHALGGGWPNALVELRQDLVEREADQAAWAERLAPIMEDARRAMR